MITIYIDNKPYQVEPGRNLLHVGLSLGFDLPYFCWHPAMHSVGACRQCAVKQFKDEKDTRGRIVMACMTPVTEGMRVSIDDPDAKAFRKSVIEWLMLNHPHDCPVCDEGGECHLQDMTVMTGHVYRRTRFKKRTYRNQDLGPFVNHEMNRCIQCYRCVRFYRDSAGGRDFNVFASHDSVYFGRSENGTLESEFSGNLVEICPTGVFTDKTLKQHYTRKWDLQTAPSICVHCGVGCNTIPGERYGTLRRIRNRYHYEVNGYFLCDRGRYGYEFVNSNKRIRKPIVKSAPTSEASTRPEEQYHPVSKEEGLRAVKDIFAKSKGVIGIGSPRASLESNFALQTLVGADNFYAGLSDQDHALLSLILEILGTGPAKIASLHDISTADAVLVLGEDLTNTAPMLDFAVRQSKIQQAREAAAPIKVPEWDDAAVRNATQGMKPAIFTLSAAGTKLDEIAGAHREAAPDDIARLGFAIAHEIDQTAAGAQNLTQETASLAKTIAQALGKAKRPVVISGTGLKNEAVIRAAANIAWALTASGKPAGLCYAVPECNSLGLALFKGKNLKHAMDVVHAGKADTVIILENDLYIRSDEKSVDQFLKQAAHVIVLDQLVHPTVFKSELSLPAATFAEADGTLVNNEGRAQRFYQVFVPDHDIQESWKWIRDILSASGRAGQELWGDLDDITKRLASSQEVFRMVTDVAPSAGFRTAGEKVPRQPHRYSGRTAMLANVTVHEPKPPDDPDTALTFSMEGYEGIPPSALISHYWVPGWNSVQSLNKFQQEVGGLLRGGVPGTRLIEPSNAAQVRYFKQVPDGFKPSEKAFLILPFHHIFGSDELSVLSPGIARLTPAPYITLSSDDAKRLGVRSGETVEISVAGKEKTFPVHVNAALAPGTAGLFSGPAGPGFSFVSPIRKK